MILLNLIPEAFKIKTLYGCVHCLLASKKNLCAKKLKILKEIIVVLISIPILEYYLKYASLIAFCLSFLFFLTPF